MGPIPYNDYERFFELARRIAKTHPFLVLQTFYDLSVISRNEYPAPKSCMQVASDIKNKVHHYLSLLDNGSKLFPMCQTAVKSFSDKSGGEDVKDSTGDVYGPLWRQFDLPMQFEYAKKALFHRIEKNGFKLRGLEGKLVIDIGCGSGRFACALASFGPREVIAYDWGESGLETGRAMAEELGIKNIRFEKGSILELPYGAGIFDFCFANGVFHHTQDMWKGLKEQFRIMKKGGAGWLYLYGDGGFFWYSRKKMRAVTRLIPMRYAEYFLKLIDHDRNWFVPMDNWFVPIEEHTSADRAERFLRALGYKEFIRTRYGLAGDKTLEFLESDKLAPELFGEGELRYILYK